MTTAWLENDWVNKESDYHVIDEWSTFKGHSRSYCAFKYNALHVAKRIKDQALLFRLHNGNRGDFSDDMTKKLGYKWDQSALFRLTTKYAESVANDTEIQVSFVVRY